MAKRLFLVCIAGLLGLSTYMVRAQITQRDTLATIDTLLREDEIATITLQTDDDGATGSRDAAGFISSILNSGRDPFLQAANFNFFAARFRPRGYDNIYTTTIVNGVPVNDLEDSRTDFRDWRGLNDVFRRRQFTYGIGADENGFGDLGGVSSVDTRASSQMKQTRASYAITNRSYRHRVMLTHNTGLLSNNWAYSFSVSHSWAQEGFIDGTFFDGSAYFASIDKKVSDKHQFNLTFFGSPSTIGRSTPAVQYLNDITGNNFYNPQWGYQNGKKRNARVDRFHQPVGILRHDYTPSSRTHMITTASFQSGRSGRTTLDWYQANNPFPDYYLRLPYTMSNPETAKMVEEYFKANPNELQIQWHDFYNINRGNIETNYGVTGRRSQIILAEMRSDSREANFYNNFRHQLTDRTAIHTGLSYQYYKGLNYMTVFDLLGGDYYVNYNRFALRDFPSDSIAGRFDLNNPNPIVREGDRYGYDYDVHVRNAGAWSQVVTQLARLDVFAAARIDNTSFWRHGNTRHGLFPDNSLGASAKQHFLTGGVKGGVTYKLSGRHAFYTAGIYQTAAPLFRDVYVSPRTRNLTAADTKPSKSYGIEGGYILRAPNVLGRLTAYYTQFEDLINTRSFFHDEFQAFVNYTMTGMGQLHRGIEAATSVKLHPSWSVRATAAYGRHIYNRRPLAIISRDNDAAPLQKRIVYINNYYVPNSPQQAYNITLSHNNTKFWFANLSFNYFADAWLDMNFDRRTLAGISYDDYGIDRVLPGSALYKQILDQERLPAAYTADLFGGKSWRLRNRQFIYLTIGVNNLTNNVFKMGGFEQLRFDYENKNLGRFPNRYIYAQGTNYFIQMSWRY